jgi:uncharacterized protein DUF4062
VIIDGNAAALQPEEAAARAWIRNQRVFISSAMGDTGEGRRAVAEAVAAEGGQPVWFEEFGRDASPDEAYMAEVDSATIYFAILNELYGRQMPPEGFSATELEYMRARERGKRVNVWVAENAPAREGHLSRFINERLRVFITTESFSDTADLARRVRRRLTELAAEDLSPWVKVDELVFRADEIDDRGSSLAIRARLDSELLHRLETIRDEQYSRTRHRLAYGDRVVEGELAGLQRRTRAGGSSEVTLEFAQVAPPQSDRLRAGAGGISSEEQVEVGLRHQLFGEPLPEALGPLGFMAASGIDDGDLRQAFEFPNEYAEAVTRLVISDGLLGSGNAGRIVEFRLGPRLASTRRLRLEWEDARRYTNVEPSRRVIEGEWRLPAAE